MVKKGTFVPSPASRVTVDDHNEYIKKNWEDQSDAELAQNCGLTVGAVEHRRLRLGITRKAKPKAVNSYSTDIEHSIIKHLKKTPGATHEDIANTLDKSPKRIKEAIASLKKRGHNLVIRENKVKLSKEIERAPKTVIDIKKLEGKTVRFGLTADNHLCSKYERPEVLNALFDIWEKEGIDTVYQLGNMIEGERHSQSDIHVHGMQEQVNYFVKNWPEREGITTKFVTGDDHEGWYVQDEGINIGKFIQMTAESETWSNGEKKKPRHDLVHLGYMEHDIHFKGTKQTSVMRLIHAGGGSSYATSYSVQKIVESYQGGEKPKILLVGHYHKAEYGYPREVHVVQAGTTKDQDSFLRKNKISSHIGGWIIEFTVTPHGDISRFKTEWIPFYDRDFYGKKWSYKW